LWSNAWGLNHALAGAIHVFVAEKVDGLSFAANVIQ
jgi:hypothetical protein